MVQFTTPLTILQSESDTLLGQLPKVFDGDVDGVHDARVATRRIREVLPLTHEWHHRNIEDLATRFKRVNRALGKVRDADVRIRLLSYLEAHVPPAAPSLVVVRQERERKRLKAMRKLIKRFERFEVERMLRDVGRPSWRQLQPWTSILGAWRHELARTLTCRAHDARESIDHMSGVYFPNRAHVTRIALKKFRYAAEIAEATGVGTIDGSIRELKKGQDILGDLHDRQVLIEKLPKTATSEYRGISADHIRTVVEALEAECRELFRQYVSRRSDLVEICRRTEEMFSARRATAAAVTAGVVALSSAAYAWRRFSTKESRPEEVSIRIPIDRGTIAAR